MTGMNKPDDFILATGVIDSESVDLRYGRKLFSREPDIGATSMNYELAALLAMSEEPA